MRKSTLIYGSIITLAVSLFGAVLVAIVGWGEKLQDSTVEFHAYRYSAFDLLLFWVIPLELGTIVYLAAIVSQHLVSERSFTLSAALLNYAVMVVEASGIALAFALGEFHWLNMFLVYLLFGFRLFSYPRAFTRSLLQLGSILAIPTISFLLARGAPDLVSYLFGMGYFIVAALIATTLLVAVRYYFHQRGLTKKNAFTQRYLLAAIGAFLVLLFIPALVDYHQSFHLYNELTFLNVLAFVLFVGAQSWVSAKAVVLAP